MAVVKFVHILKRMEAIERDIAELRNLESGLQNDRAYTHALLNAIEGQINTLLNERVKLMDLKIENPPEYLQNTVHTFQDELIHSPSVSLESLTHRNPDTLHSVPPAPEGGYYTETISATDKSRRVIRVEKPDPVFHSAPPVKEMKSEPKREQRSRADIIRELPPLEY